MTDQTPAVAAQGPAPGALLGFPRQSLFWAVALGHITNDTFMSMGPVLLVFLGSTILPMSAAQIGLAVGVRDIISGLSQPPFGWVSDRTGARWIGAGGVAWVVALLMLSLVLALTGHFWLMVIPFALSALGSGAFHPVGTMHAVRSDPLREATNTAYFFLFGQTGLALGPALAGILLDSASAPTLGLVFGETTNPLTPIFALSAVAIPGVLLMALTIPAARQRLARVTPSTPKIDSRSPSRVTRAVIVPLLVMGTVVMLRSVVHSGSSSFVPALFERKGWSPAQYGLITSSFWIASALAGVVFGRLADRYDRRRVIALTLLFAAPSLFFLPLADGPLAFALALAAGGLVGGSFSIFIVLAQRMLPTGKAFASGAILGFTFVTGALGTMLTGVIADGPAALLGAQPGVGGGIGLEATYHVMAAMMLVASLLALALPKWVSAPAARPDVT